MSSYEDNVRKESISLAIKHFSHNIGQVRPVVIQRMVKLARYSLTAGDGKKRHVVR